MSEQRNISIRVRLGNRIRQLRKQQPDLTLRKFALMIDVSYPYLSKVENGKQSVTVDILDKIARGLNVPISALFENIDDDVNQPKG